MQDWIHGIRGQQSSSTLPLASLEVTLPFPKVTTRAALDQLLYPSDPTTVLSQQHHNTPTGLVSLLHPLYPLHGRQPFR